MCESLLSHVILCGSLQFSEEKIRPSAVDQRSKFLSSLALVLNGNATCTAVYVQQAEKTVYIARNEPITPDDRRYFDRFFRLIQIYAHNCFDETKEAASLAIREEIYSILFEYNSKKIIRRLDQHPVLIEELRKLSQWDAEQMKPFVEELRSNAKTYKDHPLITEKIHLLSENRTDEEYVQFLFEILRQFLEARDELLCNKYNPTDHQIRVPTGRAKNLYQSRLFQHILKSTPGTIDKGVYYLEKASGHGRSINLILKCLLIRKDSLSDLYKNITWKLVPPFVETRRLTITPRKAFGNIFTQVSSSLDQDVLQNISVNTFYDQHVKQMIGFDDEAERDVHMHAEILLIDYLLKMNINETHQSKEVEIGISKMSCLLCFYYIKELNRKYDRCFCIPDSTNGKIYSKWVPRPNEDGSILDVINEKLIVKLQESIKCLVVKSARRKPTKSGDSDIMFTSIEEEKFDKMVAGIIE